MVKVYFETKNNSYSEIVAIFEEETMYDACYSTLAALAFSRDMIMTESVDELEIKDLVTKEKYIKLQDELTISNDNYRDSELEIDEISDELENAEDEINKLNNSNLLKDDSSIYDTLKVKELKRIFNKCSLSELEKI